MSNENLEVILTAYEVECLTDLIEVTEAKLEYEKLILKKYRDGRKIQSGEENVNPDSGYVQTVYDISTTLEYYKLLLSNYRLAQPETDAVEIGSYVTVYFKDTKKETSFLVVQETRVPASQTQDIKLVSEEAPMVSAIMGKKVDEPFKYIKPNGEETQGFITELDNNFCKTVNKQKTK